MEEKRHKWKWNKKRMERIMSTDIFNDVSLHIQRSCLSVRLTDETSNTLILLWSLWMQRRWFNILIVTVLFYDRKVRKACETLVSAWTHLCCFLTCRSQCFAINKTPRWSVKWGISVSLDDVLYRSLSSDTQCFSLTEWSGSLVVTFWWMHLGEIWCPVQQYCLVESHSTHQCFTWTHVLLLQPITLPTLCVVSHSSSLTWSKCLPATNPSLGSPFKSGIFAHFSSLSLLKIWELSCMTRPPWVGCRLGLRLG